MKLGEGFFSKKAKKASRLLMAIRRDYRPKTGGLDFSSFNMGADILGGIISFLFARKVGRQRV